MHDVPTHHGTALRCLACGATLSSSAPLRAAEVCRCCGAVNRHDPELLDALADHRREVDEQFELADGAQREHVQAEVSRSLGGGWALGLVGSWLLAGLLAPLSILLALVVFAGPFVVLSVVIATRRRSIARELADARVRVEGLPLHCPTCGGQSESRPEAPLLACRYCGGALAADEHALAELLARARAGSETEVHRARMAAWRLAGKQQREPATDLVPYFVIGGIGSLWVIGTLVTDLRGLVGGPRPASGELWAMNLVALAIVLGVGVPLLRRRARVRRWESQMAQLGEVQTDLNAAAQWLCAHWCGELASARIRGGLGHGFVASAREPRWAVSLAPWSIAEFGVRHVEVWVPGKRGPMLERCAEGLEALGFACSWSDGGLVAELPLEHLPEWIADPRPLARLRATLDRLSDARLQ
jgi:hypothetical protein